MNTVLHTHDTNATVHASAGSGKTYLLVSRMIHLLLKGARPDAILAITFTRKAAMEMRDRLLARLFALASADDEALSTAIKALDLHPDPAMLETARTLYESLLCNAHSVTTTTFHAFCHDLLRRFPMEATVPPGFELIELTRILQTQAWEALTFEATQDLEGETAQALDSLFQDIGLANTKTCLMNFLAHRSDWWAFTENKTDPIYFAITQLTDQLDIHPHTDPLKELFSDPLFLQRLKQFKSLLEKHPIKTNQNFAQAIDNGLQIDRDPPQRLMDIDQVFFKRDGDPRPRTQNKTLVEKVGPQGVDKFLRLHEQCCEQLNTTHDQLAAQRTLKRCHAWYQVGQHLLEHYQQLKREQRLLDFTDLEWKTYELLTQGNNALWVQYKLDTRIDHLLIDEFQDTNPTQWHMLLPLLEELAAGSQERQRSVFLVGDSKQSIYRFRRAEPRLFDTASQWLKQNLGAKSFSLDKSWRSAPAIIEFVNTLFNSDQLKNRLSSFTPHLTQHTSLWGYVELLPLITTEQQNHATSTELRNPLLTPRAESVDQRHFDEGKQIAAKIHALINNNTTIGPESSARLMNLDDIIILLRTRTHVADYERALREASIPYLGAERGSLLDCLEIKDMVDLLRWLMLPDDDLALASVLRSPLFSATDEDLMQLANNPTGRWTDHLANIAKTRKLNSSLHCAHRLLSQWQTLSGRIPVHDLLDRIYSEGNVLARYEAAYPHHLKARVSANLTRLLELALEMDSGRYPSLMRFIASLNELQQHDSESPDEPPSSGQQQRVRILTIHAAKGLEAPVIFLADAARPFSDKTPYQTWVNWPAMSKLPHSFILSGLKRELDPFSRQHLQQHKAEQLQEQTNLLYVAVTRSQQLLFISGSKPSKGNDLGWYGDIANSFMLNEEDLIQNKMLTQSGKPSRHKPPVAIKSKKIIRPDPRLAQRLDIPLVNKEIAPSHIHTARHSTDAGINTSTDADSRLRGITLHKLLELLTDNSHTKQQILLTTARAMNLADDDAELLCWYNEAHALIQQKTLHYLFNSQHYQHAYNEMPIIYELDTTGVHGVIDRIVLTDEKVFVVDYKTHAHATQNNLDNIAQNYTQQMYLYVQGVQRLWPQKKIQGLLLFTACGIPWLCASESS